MRRFVTKGSAFGLGFVALFAGVSVYYHFHFQEQDNFAKQLRMFNAADRSIRVLFLGDSHVHRGIRNRYLPGDFFNLGMDNESLREVYLKLRYAYRLHPEIECVALQLDYHTLSSYRDQAFNLSRAVYYSDVNELAEVYDKPRLALKFHAFGHRYVPLLYNRNRQVMATALVRKLLHVMLGRKAEKSIDLDEYGDPIINTSRAHGGVWTRRYAGERMAEASHSIQTHFSQDMVEDALVKDLDMIVAFCRRHGIRVVGMTYPLTREYRRLMANHDTRYVTEVYEAEDICPRLDYASLYDEAQQLFDDSDHLNPAGAAEFTARAVQDIEAALRNCPTMCNGLCCTCCKGNHT